MFYHSFPPGDVKKDLFTDSATHTTCGWKGGEDVKEYVKQV